MIPRLPLLLAALATGSLASAQDLLIVESTNDTVMRFSAVDGSLIDPAFIDLTTSTGSTPSTPIECIIVGSEYWISDQLADTIFVFDMAGAYVGEHATGMLDNARGHGLANGFDWVSNSGTGGAGYDDSLVQFDLTGAFVNFHVAGDPFDTLDWNGMILTADIAGDDIDMHDYAGTYLGEFHDSDGVTGIDFPEQIAVKPSNGNILAAGFSTPSGIFEYDPTGVEVNFIDTGAIAGLTGLRGIAELDNGNLIFTNGSGVHIYDVGAGTISTVLAGVSGRFITRVEPGGPDCPDLVYCDTNPDNASDLTIDDCDTTAGSNNLLLSNAPANQFGYPIVGAFNGVSTDPPGAQGDLCLIGGTIGRYDQDASFTDGSGNNSWDIWNSLTGGGGGGLPNPPGGAIMPGDTWNFQAWHRDGMGPSKFSKAIQVTFQ